MTALAPTLETFLTQRLMIQRGASPNTVASYRVTFRLLLRFAADRKGKRPCDLDFADLDAALIVAFLEHLEMVRGNSVRTRNNRLSAIHSLFAYAALRHPEHAGMIQRVLAIPVKLPDSMPVAVIAVIGTPSESETMPSANCFPLPDRSLVSSRCAASAWYRSSPARMAASSSTR